MSLEPPMEAIDPAALSGIVQRALGGEVAEVADWEIARLHGGTSASTGGVYRVAGVARDAGGTRPWSVVLKVLRAPDIASASGAIPVEGWDREAQAYRSGLLAALPAGLAAPRCFAVEERPGAIWLWLEQITEASSARWPIAEFARAARHLGRLNGAYLAARPLPDHPWLLRNLLRFRAARNAEFWADFDSLRNTAAVHALWPGDLGDRARRLWVEREALLAQLDSLPQTLVHGDADRRNLFARWGPSGPETVAIDWGFVGVAALGEELVNLVMASVFWFQADAAELPSLADACLDGYAAGLRDAGWDGDPRLAHVGFALGSALRYGPFSAAQLARITPERLAQAAGRPVEEWLACATAMRHFAFDRLDAARGLRAAL